MYLQLFKAVHTIFGHQFTLTPCPYWTARSHAAAHVNGCPEIPSLSLSNWRRAVSPFMHFPSLPFSLYTHNTHEIFTQSILPWTISVAQLVPRVVVLRWRRRRIYAMYAISLLLLLSSTSAMIFIDSGALLREESMEDGKMPGPCFQRFANF